MNMIRTTVSLREDVYDNLRRLVVAKRMSLSGIVNVKLAGGFFSLPENEVRQQPTRRLLEGSGAVLEWGGEVSKSD